MENHLYSTLQFDSWKEYKLFVDDLSDNWAFRGQRDALWVLNNAIERTEFIHFNRTIEASFLAEFQRGARNYLTKDETPEHIIEWLALMQHHGAPTRLLDFTKSPYVAAFFAFENCLCYPEQPTGIWAINVHYFRSRALEVLSQVFAEELKLSNNLIDEHLFEKIFYSNRYSLVFPVEPFRMNRRYSLQQSIFMSTGNSYEPFMKQLEFLGAEISKAVIKIQLPSLLQKEVLRNLQRMNLNRASLFPDLDGYAASLKLRYNSMQNPEEKIETQMQLLEDKNFKFFP